METKTGKRPEYQYDGMTFEELDAIWKKLHKDIGANMTEEDKYALFQKLKDSDKYEEILNETHSGRNDNDLSYGNKVIYYSKVFKIWVTIEKGATGRRARGYYFNITKSYQNPAFSRDGMIKAWEQANIPF